MSLKTRAARDLDAAVFALAYKAVGIPGADEIDFRAAVALANSMKSNRKRRELLAWIALNESAKRRAV